MTLLSSVISQFQDRFLNRYQHIVLPGHLQGHAGNGTMQARAWAAYAGTVFSPDFSLG